MNPPAPRWLTLGLAAALAVAAVLLLVDGFTEPAFGADSWSLYELSRTFGNDFYRFTTWRSFFSEQPYSQAFPPLWPAIIAAADWVTGLGMNAAMIMAVLCMLGFGLLAERLARRVFEQPGAGLLSALAMLAYAPLRTDVAAGGTLALQLLLLSALALALMTPRLAPVRRALLVGAIGGAMVMNRFDAAPVLLGVLATFWIVHRSLPATLAAALTAGVVMSPWILYSSIHFGRPFATDNSLIATAIDPALYVIDFLTAAPRTVADEPLAWVAKIAGNVLPLIKTLVQAALASWLLLPLGLLAVVLWAVRGRDRRGEFHAQLCASHWLAALLLGAVLCLGCLAFLTTGYFRLRYLAPLIWWVEFMLLLVALQLARSPVEKTRIAGVAAGVVAVLALALPIHSLLTQPSTGRSVQERGSFAALQQCLRDAGATPRDAVMFFDDNQQAAMFGALTQWRASMKPSNWDRLTPQDRAAFAEKFAIRYVTFGAGPAASCEQRVVSWQNFSGRGD
jgi:hypothetical protein